MTKQTLAVTKRELKQYFNGPLGYVFMIIFLFAIGQVTFEAGRGSFFLLRQADLTPFFNYIPWLYMILIPAISMKSWAEERKSGSIEFFLTLPITLREAVLGKYLAGLIFVFLCLLGTLPMVFTVAYLGSPDFLVIMLGYLASFFVGASFLSIGNFFSALTKNQVVSFILSVVVCYLFLMAGSPPILEFFSSFLPSYLVSLFENLSVSTHFEAMIKGVIKIGDLWFFFCMAVGPLLGCINLLESKKAN